MNEQGNDELEKVKIYTYADKRPDFIALQYKSIGHFLRNPFELIVFNNCSLLHYRRRRTITETCEGLGLRCILVDGQDHTNPNVACAKPIQWSFHNYLKKENGLVCIIDSDMFLVAEFDLRQYMSGYDIAAVKQVRGHVRYMWNGLMFFNIPTLPSIDHMNFMCGLIDGVATDVGGFLYYWIRENPHARVRNILHTSHIYSGNNNLACLPQKVLERYNEDYRFELYERAFLHYGRGSNWDRMNRLYHRNKTELTRYFVESAMAGDVRVPDYDYVFEYDCWGGTMDKSGANGRRSPEGRTGRREPTWPLSSGCFPPVGNYALPHTMAGMQCAIDLIGFNSGAANSEVAP